MNDTTARAHSAQIVDSGYARWLVNQIKHKAELAFSSADEQDVRALQRAKNLYDLAILVETLIKDNARQ